MTQQITTQSVEARWQTICPALFFNCRVGFLLSMIVGAIASFPTVSCHASCGANFRNFNHSLVMPYETVDGLGAKNWLSPNRQWVYHEGKLSWRLQENLPHSTCPECRKSRSESPLTLPSILIARPLNWIARLDWYPVDTMVLAVAKHRRIDELSFWAVYLDPSVPPPR